MDSTLPFEDVSYVKTSDVLLSKDLPDTKLNLVDESIEGYSDAQLCHTVENPESSLEDDVLMIESDPNVNKHDCSSKEVMCENIPLNGTTSKSDVEKCISEETQNTVNSSALEAIISAENDIHIEERTDFDNTDNQHNSNYDIEYCFKQIPFQITGAWKEFSSATRNNYTRGCKWAPDGSCILTCSDDNLLRIFNLPHQLWDSSQWHEISELEAVIRISEGELIYDFCWYPLMNSSDPSTCCLASTSKSSTVHLWDGFNGDLRCSYRAYNHLDEIATPHSLSFDVDGQRLFCGFEKIVRIFDVNLPGREFDERRIFAKKSGQSGIISCFAFTSSNRNVSAAASYDKTIGIYSEPAGHLECLLGVQSGGITHIQFSPDGKLLYSGGRKDPDILCWDIRNLGSVLFSLRRSCVTNQRMYFDISSCGKYIVSGNHNGVITFWDTRKEPTLKCEDDFHIMEPIKFFMAHDDCVNGISLHPTFPLLCSSSGQRKFPDLLSEDDEDIFSNKIKCNNSLRLWWLGKFE